MLYVTLGTSKDAYTSISQKIKTMNGKTITTIILVILLLIVFWVMYQFGGITKIILSNVALNEEENLREVYISSIQLNYNSTDTVIVETAWSFCGNDVPGDRPVIFSLNLEDTKTKNLLQKR
ncbi:MAG: hypothetical protein H7282_17080, partial [Cytophagaceae bacterium]|nr:hypothetical protein [Cytophagaceae bacterium]